MQVFAAVDLGASGGRVMAGTVDGDAIRVEPVHRFANGVVERDGHLRWPTDELFVEVERGLAMVDGAASIGIDTWGVDYGLLDADGHLVADPIAYRDGRTDAVIDEVHAVASREELFAITGLQFLPFNTIYQLVAEQQRASHALLMPDLVAYRLTGIMGTEPTNASTTGLFDVTTRRFSSELLTRLDIPVDLFPPLDGPGDVRGSHNGVPVITVGSHDTASAVVAVPATTDRFAYIASGTWSLVGLELPSPVLTDAARIANFTNELGVDGRVRFLRNVGGLWLLQECMRTWGRDDLDVLLAQAAAVVPSSARVDVDHPHFIAPDDMPRRIAAAAGADLDPPAMVRCILDSLADGYARTLREATVLAQRTIDVVHVVGGGSQNELLCQLTANATGLPVIAGPVEATALGNVAVQARAAGAMPTSLEGIRERIAASVNVRTYLPG